MKKKILIAESGTGFGGSAKYLANLLPLLDRQKFEVEVAAAGGGPFIRQIEKDGWTVHHVPAWRFPWVLAEAKHPFRFATYALFSGIQLLVLMPWIAFWLWRRKIRLVHLNNEILSHLPLLLAAHFSGVKVICHLHGWRHLTGTEKWASRYVDQFLSVTQSGADFYTWQLGGKEVLGVPNGLPEEVRQEESELLEKRRVKREELKLRDDEVLAVIIGRMIPLKGHSVFFKALAEARCECPNLRALVVGNDPSGGPYERKLREELKAFGLEQTVLFLPWQDHMGPIYEASDIIVQPSIDPESFGYVALEGMMAKRPVIASRIGGLCDVVEDGQTGYLVEAANSGDLARSIRRLSKDRRLRAELGEKGSKRAAALFTMEKNSAAIQKIYQRLLSGPASRILIAESGTGYGGSAKYLASLIPYLKDEFSVEVLSYSDGPFIRQIQKSGFPVTFCPFLRFSWGEVEKAELSFYVLFHFIASIFQIIFLTPLAALWLKRHRIALVHLNNGTLSHLPLLIAARLSGTRTICHFHGWRFLTRSEKWFAPFVDEFIAISEGGAKFFEKHTGRRAVAISNGLSLKGELDHFERKRELARNQLGLENESKAVVIAGRLVPWKGQDIYLRALSKVIAKNPKVAGIILGRDPDPNQKYLKELKRLSGELGIEERVRFLPWQEDVWSVYAAADIFVHASKEPEPFGFVILEAMLAGKPVIATRGGGVDDILVPGDSGYLVERGDVDDLAAAIEKLIQDPELAGRLARAGQIRAQSGFTMEANADQVKELYRRLLELSAPARQKFNLTFKHTLATTGALSLIRSSRSDQIPILMYHRVSDERDPFFPAVSSKTFREQMRYVKRFYDVLSLDELAGCWTDGKKLLRRSLAVTFDDGYAETWSVVHPILKELKISATVFPVTDFLEGKELIWTDLLRWWIKFTAKEHCALDLNGYSGKWSLTCSEERLSAARDIIGRLKTMPNDYRQTALERLGRELEVGRERLPANTSLTKDQIRTLKDEGVTFGAHTLSHPILSRLPAEDARFEIFECKKRLEKILGRPVRHFAYPNGKSGDFSKEHEAWVAEAGFWSGVSAIHGLNGHQTNRFALKRVYATEEALVSFAVRLVGLGS